MKQSQHNTSNEPTPEYGNTRRAVPTFGISKSTLYRAAAVGGIRWAKIGRSRLWDFNSIRAFLAARTK